MKNEIVIFENQEVKLEVNMKEKTVWLNAKQMSELFGREESNIRRHIINIFKEKELEEENNVQKMHVDGVKQLVPFYSLDVIISVGYRVKSKNGVIFRQWATKVLNDFMIKGYAVNEQRLRYLEKTVKLLDIANRGYENTDSKDSKEILRVITEYTKGLDMLDDYDHRSFKKIKGRKSSDMITYQECLDIIADLRFHEESDLFALERNQGLEAIIGNIYQTFNGNDVYPTLEEKASNFLYMVVKNHVFIDGNKRIAATLFIYFLQYYGMLYVNGMQIIDNNTLTALTLLIAESNPKEKEVIIDLIINFLN